MPTLDHGLRAAAWSGGLIAAACAVWALSMPHEISYVEGYMLEQAARLASGSGLYQDPQQTPWIFDNFPPFWIWVLSLGDRLFGMQYVVGRVLNVVAVGVLTLVLSWHARRRGDAPWMVLGAVALWLLSAIVLRRMMLVRMDLPALALMALGMMALARRPDARGAAWAVPLFVLAMFSRQTSLLAPLAAAAGLWWAGRRRTGVAVLLATAVGAALVAAWLQGLTDGRFLDQVVLHNTGRWDLLRMLRYNAYLVGGHFVLLGLGVLGWWRRRGEQDVASRMLWTWAALNIATVWTLGKPGTASNHFLPLIFTLALHAGPGLAVLHRRFGARGPNRAVALQVVVLLVPLAWQAPAFVAAQDDADHVVALLEQTPGPVLCESAGLLLEAGHEVLLEPRTTLEQHEAGRWDDGPLVSALENRTFSLVVTERFSPHRAATEGMRFSDDSWSALEQAYARAEVHGRWQVWRPA